MAAKTATHPDHSHSPLVRAPYLALVSASPPARASGDSVGPASARPKRAPWQKLAESIARETRQPSSAELRYFLAPEGQGEWSIAVGKRKRCGDEFSTVVLDEAQAIKNDASATAKCAKRLRAAHRIALSGTPIENHLGELWSLFEFLNPGMLTELPGLQRALRAGQTRPETLQLIQRVLRPFVLRRTKREVAPRA